MRFLVDAHLPRSLCAVLARQGHDAIHTLDLPKGNATKDRIINQVSLDDQRVVISKDADFFYSHVLQGRPWKLVLVKTGNTVDKSITIANKPVVYFTCQQGKAGCPLTWGRQ